MHVKGIDTPIKPTNLDPKDIKMVVRQEVFVRDKFTCQDCNKKFQGSPEYTGRRGIKGLTLGHVIPRCLGGRFNPGNLRAQCEPCNAKLGKHIWAKELRKALTHYVLK